MKSLHGKYLEKVLHGRGTATGFHGGSFRFSSQSMIPLFLDLITSHSTFQWVGGLVSGRLIVSDFEIAEIVEFCEIVLFFHRN